jgi:hypothetical protein
LPPLLLLLLLAVLAWGMLPASSFMLQASHAALTPRHPFTPATSA